MVLPFPDLEMVYEKLAQAIDSAGESKTPLFLAKLALVLARQQDNRNRALAAIDDCLKDILDEPAAAHMSRE
jgi:hypothetical protein